LFLRRLVSLNRDRLAPPFTPARLALEFSVDRSDDWRYVEDFGSCRRSSRHVGLKSPLVLNAARP
jgi:hypothetical protein